MQLLPQAPPGGRADRIVRLGVTREVLSFYRVGGDTTGNEAEVKLETLKARLLGRPAAGAALLVSAEEGGRPAIDDFLAALGQLDRLVGGG